MAYSVNASYTDYGGGAYNVGGGGCFGATSATATAKPTAPVVGAGALATVSPTYAPTFNPTGSGGAGTYMTAGAPSPYTTAGINNAGATATVSPTFTPTFNPTGSGGAGTYMTKGAPSPYTTAGINTAGSPGTMQPTFGATAGAATTYNYGGAYGGATAGTVAPAPNFQTAGFGAAMTTAPAPMTTAPAPMTTAPAPMTTAPPIISPATTIGGGAAAGPKLLPGQQVMYYSSTHNSQVQTSVTCVHSDGTIEIACKQGQRLSPSQVTPC